MDASQEQWRPIPGYNGHYEVSDLGRVRSIDRIIPIGPEKLCSFDGCNWTVRRNGLCKAHSYQRTKNQTLTPVRPRTDDDNCTFPGCRNTKEARGLCHGHYCQKGELRPLGWRPGKMLAPRMTQLGYLAVSMRRPGCKPGSRFIHRLVAETFLGQPDEGQEVRHLNDIKTDNRLCNIRWGTRSENVRDRIANGIHHHAAKTACKHGHEYTPQTMVVKTRPNGRTTRVCLVCQKIRADLTQAYGPRRAAFCEWCGQPIVGRGPNAKACSTACRKKNWKLIRKKGA